MTLSRANRVFMRWSRLLEYFNKSARQSSTQISAVTQGQRSKADDLCLRTPSIPETSKFILGARGSRCLQRYSLTGPLYFSWLLRAEALASTHLLGSLPYESTTIISSFYMGRKNLPTGIPDPEKHQSSFRDLAHREDREVLAL